MMPALGMSVFGVPGMTTGAVTIITMLFGGGLVWFIRGMADRRRAENENVTTLSGAHDSLFKNMQASHDVQFNNMQKAHDILIKNMQFEINRLSELVTELSTELNVVKKELSEERMARLGEMKNSVQVDLAASALLSKGDGE